MIYPIMFSIIIQCNLNRSWDAQHLLVKQAQEMRAEACMISELPRNMKSANWFSSKDGLAAIYLCDPNGQRKDRLIKQAENFVTVKWGDIFLISIYISLNANRSDFLTFLDELTTEVHLRKERVLICGDFNSKSTHWEGKRTDTRGALVEEWAAECNLRLLNIGDTPTCVRPQG